MQHIVTRVAAIILFFASNQAPLLGNEASVSEESSTNKVIPFQSFTGQVTKNRVRVRLHPTLDSTIVREVDKGEMLVVIGEDDEFYAVKPFEEMKGYIFRTYILDGTIEGNHVNVRLSPSLEGDVIAQLNSGDRIEGRISPTNSKWMEIAAPQDTKLYISKDYVEKIGAANYLAEYRRRQDEVNKLLSAAYLNSESSLKGSYRDINEDSIIRQFETIVKDYPDFEEQAEKAKELMTSFQENFMKKKIAYLENSANQNGNHEELKAQNSKLTRALNEQQTKLQQLETEVNTDYPGNSGTMLIWEPVEERIYTAWTQENPDGTVEDFYRAEFDDSVKLRGTIEPYNRSIKNKPGDYILLNSSGVPVAYLYSTRVNLQELVGHEKTLIATPRPNNNFAFPAYFILNIDE